MRVHIFDQHGDHKECPDLLDYARRVSELRHPAILPVWDVHTSVDGRWRVITAGLPEQWELYRVAAANRDSRLGNDLRSRPSDQVSNGFKLACSIVRTLAETHAYLYQMDFRGGRPFSWRTESLAVTLAEKTWRMTVLPPLPGDFYHSNANGRLYGFEFAAPEIIVSDRYQVTERVDSYSLAAVFFHLVTGQRLVHGDSVFDCLNKIIAGEFVPIESLRPDLPQDCLRIVRVALSRDPAARPSLRDWSLVMQQFGGQVLPPPLESTSKISPRGIAPVAGHHRVLGPTQNACPVTVLNEEKIGSDFAAEIEIGAAEVGREDREPHAESHDPQSLEGFDAYWRWLGIPENEQPPNHYRLLGLRLFEFDELVISLASEQRLLFLSRIDGSKHPALLRELQNKVSSARQCLLNTATKSAYDLALEQKLRGGVHDNVQFTIYRPRSIAPERWHSLLAFAHLDQRPEDAPADEADPRREVARQAEQALGRKIADYSPTTQDSRGSVPREGELTFIPEMEGVRFDPARQVISFLESVNKVEFRIRAEGRLDGQTARGRLSVFLGAIILADVPLQIMVDSNPRSTSVPEPVSFKRYRRVFASYSHKDHAIVSQCERFAESMGDRYVRDCKDLRSGERWDERLLELIEQADVFQLFWSSNAMLSPYCRREWEHALSLSRDGFIRPTYWETPLPTMETEGLPPQQLLDLHFTQLLISTNSSTNEDWRSRSEMAPQAPKQPEATPWQAATRQRPLQSPRSSKRSIYRASGLSFLLPVFLLVGFFGLVLCNYLLRQGPAAVPVSVPIRVERAELFVTSGNQATDMQAILLIEDGRDVPIALSNPLTLESQLVLHYRLNHPAPWRLLHVGPDGVTTVAASSSDSQRELRIPSAVGRSVRFSPPAGIHLLILLKAPPAPDVENDALAMAIAGVFDNQTPENMDRWSRLREALTDDVAVKRLPQDCLEDVTKRLPKRAEPLHAACFLVKDAP